MKMSPCIRSFHSSAVPAGRTPPVQNDSQSLLVACPEPIEGCAETVGHLAVARCGEQEAGVSTVRGLIDLPLDV